MGRGRAKAKQTKVARDLKYRSYSTDFASLERELRGDTYHPVSAESADEVGDEEDDVDEAEDDEADEGDDDKYSDRTGHVNQHRLGCRLESPVSAVVTTQPSSSSANSSQRASNSSCWASAVVSSAPRVTSRE